MGKKIFISYKSDNRDIAFKMVDYLEDKGLDCFIAPRDITPGRNYASCLTEAMTECETAVLVASELINDSEHVLNEIDVLVSKKKKIIPFFLEEFELCDDLRYYLGRKQWVNAFPGYPEEYFKKLADTIDPNLLFKAEKPSMEVIPSGDEANTKTIFEYNASRGIMVNPEDHQRNVSFRSDTLLNLLGTIYRDVASKVSEESAEEIFYNAGYEGGHGFGERLCAQWEDSDASIVDKLAKWCEFDSKVGWGKFSINMSIDEETGTLEGTLRISESFAVDNKNHCHTCAYMRGYCEGVIEAFCYGVPIKLTCKECPMKNRFKNACVFSITAEEE